MTLACAVVLGLLVPPILFDLLFRPAVRRIGLRNVVRRPGEAALVVFGSMLATALITASFIVGDSFGTSFRARAETYLGPLDLVVATTDVDADLGRLNAVRSAEDTPIESVMAVREGDISAADGRGRTQPRERFWEVDPAEARRFGNDLAASGLTDLPERLGPDEVAVNADLADRLRLGTGDGLELVAGTVVRNLRIVAVLPERGLAGYAPIIVAKGVLSDAIGDRPGVIRDVIAVSNVGDTYGGARRSAAAERRIVETLGERTTVVPVKAQTLDRADKIGDQATTRFSTVGGFTVAAAVLLVVNLFVMLAMERRVELGTLRAVGVQEGHTRRAFAVEGLVYGLLATIIGVGVGLDVAALVIRTAHGLFGVGLDFDLRLGVEPTSLLSGAVIGLAISQLTVLVTTMRVVKVNIVAALKDAVPRRARGDSRPRIVTGLVLCAVAGAAWALAPDTQATVFTAPLVIAVGLIPALTALIGPRAAVTLCCGAGIAWAGTAFGLRPELFEKTEITLFIVQGVALIGLSATIVAVFDTWLVAGIRAVGKGFVASRLGLATALARPVRTALLTSMYALVIFTVTFTAVLNTVLAQEEPKDIARAGGGYDVVLFSSRASPVTAEALRGRADVARAIDLTDGYAMVASPALDTYERDQGTGQGFTDGRPVRRTVTLVTPELAGNGPPQLAERAGRFASDRDAWSYVAATPGAVIVPKYVGLEIGQTVQVVDAQSRRTDLEIVGLSDWNWLVGAGLYVSERQAALLLADTPPVVRQYVAAADGVDTTTLQAALNADYFANGADARSFAADIATQSAEATAFIEILQGFLGLGLLVGMAGLTVVLVRGVRERRQQLGMLRAIGFPPSVLRNTFLVEASFVGVQGIVLGIGLGVLCAWQVLTMSTAVARHLDFAVPGVFLAALAVAALAAALLAGLVPAIRAGRTAPAESLRLPG
ncbi:FtsX-like permease family protein [Virgisporangium aurantiacum]|uniref:ABC transporter permease n=1 Tax=Virgisporangium aurantiacum TaxID=175570 RepID=A0A8J3Z2S9_9ACTN|nr:FtsX-like permease family protein [Virgisporangium aurantiacum]GIJ56416.1 ABC transporter permease [Virgisporangium aurantiacum]